MSLPDVRNEQTARRRRTRERFFKSIPKSLKNLFKSSSRLAPREKDSGDVIVDQVAPARVQIGNSQVVQLGLEPGPDGDTLEVQRKSFQKEKAVVRIQSAFRKYKARALFESLQTLDKMNIELKWPDAIPFIGLLIVRVNTIEDLSGVRTALLRTKFDGDISSNIPGFKDKDHIIYYNHNATFVNVALRSNSVLVIEVLQSLEFAVRIIGKVTVLLQSLAQGTVERIEDIRSSSGEVIGKMNMTVGYQWLRNTVDYGGYDGPEILIMQSRKIRGTMPNQAVERLWKVNHWLCAHDNVWCTSPDFEDIVREAVRRERNRSTNIALYDLEGNSQDLDSIPSTLKFKKAFANTEQRPISSTELLQMTAGTADWSQLEDFVSLGNSVSTSASIDSLGVEDWRNALASSERSEGVSSGVVEEEVNYDYDQPPEELVLEELSNESSVSSETEEASLLNSPTSPKSPTTAPKADDSKSPDVTKCIVKKITGMMKTQESKRERPTKPCINGKFEYGAYRPASERGVHLFARRVDNSSEHGYSGLSTIYMGEHTTSKHGRLLHPVPRSMEDVPGLYNVMAMLPDDNTFGHGSLFLLEKGTKCVVFDLDGTITTSDVHVVAQTLLDSVSVSTVIGSNIGRSYDIRARPNALTCVRAWAAKGYQVIYLSGRQGSAYNMTLDWLIKHGYPPGPIHLTRTHLPTLPVYVSVGHFKIKYMEELKAKGLELYAAYGNTGTDIKAYEKVGIPKERTFIVGANGGKKNTKAVKDFTRHLPEILMFPDSKKPLPYIELLRTSPSQPLSA